MVRAVFLDGSSRERAIGCNGDIKGAQKVKQRLVSWRSGLKVPFHNEEARASVGVLVHDGGHQVQML